MADLEKVIPIIESITSNLLAAWSTNDNQQQDILNAVNKGLTDMANARNIISKEVCDYSSILVGSDD